MADEMDSRSAGINLAEIAAGLDEGARPELIKMFIDNTPIAYIILDKDYRIHYINESFAKLRKLDMAATLGDRCYNISNGGVRCANCARSTGERKASCTFSIHTSASARSWAAACTAAAKVPG